MADKRKEIVGGLGRAAKRLFAERPDESSLSAIRESGRAVQQEQSAVRAAKNAEVAEQMAKLPARNRAANEAAGLYHPIGGGLKLSKPTYGMHATTVADPEFVQPKIKIITPAQMVKEQAAIIPLVGDRAAGGRYLTHIDEHEFERPIRLTAGARYMDANYSPKANESAVWESGPGVVTKIGNQATRAGEGGRPVYGAYTAGSGTNTDFNVMGTNALLQQIPTSSFTKKAEQEFDRAMRTGTKEFPPIPDWPGIRNPLAEEMLLDKSNGIMRTKLFDTMGKENFQSMGFPDVPATRKAIIEPELLDVPTNQVGFRLAKMDTTGRIIENPKIPSDYPVAMAGKLAGRLDLPEDYKDIWQSHFDARRLLSQPEKGDYYSFSRAKPIQYADEEWLNRLMESRRLREEAIKKGSYAEGGAVDIKAADARLEAAIASRMAGGGKVDIEAADARLGQAIAQLMAGGGEVGFKKLQFMAGGGGAKSKNAPKFTEAFTQGLGPMLYGAARGTAAGLAGIGGDIEELARLGINYAGDKLQGRFPNMLDKKDVVGAKATLPTSELVLSKIPSLKDFGAGPEARHSEDIAAKLGMYGLTNIAAPKVGKAVVQGVNATGKALAPKAGEMLENYMVRTGGILPMDVWHGSPHRFPPTAKNPLGEFDASKIGTGEGAQAYGHGLYLAEARGVADEYAGKLSQKTVSLRGMTPNKDQQAILDRFSAGANVTQYGEYRPWDALQNVIRYGSPSEKVAAKQLEKEAGFLGRNFEVKDSGSLYKVDLPDEQIAKMLDWDKPLSQQAPAVQAAFRDVELRPGATGQQAYSSLKPVVNPDYWKSASSMDAVGTLVTEELRKRGIPGIRYLDEGSRSAGKGTSNFVVFPGNEEMLNILTREKDGGVVHMGGGGRSDAAKGLGKGFKRLFADPAESFVASGRKGVPPAEGMAEGGAAFKTLQWSKPQHFKNGSVVPFQDADGNVVPFQEEMEDAESPATVNPMMARQRDRRLGKPMTEGTDKRWEDVKKNAKEMYEETKTELGSDLKRLENSPAARAQLAKIWAAGNAGGGLDFLNFINEYVLDPIKSVTVDKVFTKPSSVMLPNKNREDIGYNRDGTRVPKFGSIAHALSTESGVPNPRKDVVISNYPYDNDEPNIDAKLKRIPLGGSEQMIERMQARDLMYGGKQTITDPHTGQQTQINTGRFHPIIEIGGSILTGGGLNAAAKAARKGYQRLTDPARIRASALSRAIDKDVETFTKKPLPRKRGGLAQLNTR